jgi:Na+-transporting methylmalonyl-CoA/oxaloacetate decarboxylase gamma subunit
MSDLAWGLQMTALGMGLVFGLLALLWGLLSVVQRLDGRASAAGAAPEPAARQVTAAQAVGAHDALDAEAPRAANPAPADVVAQAVNAAGSDGPAVPVTPAAPALVQGMDPELVAAILVATLRHRALLRREAAPAMRSYWPGSMLYVSRWVGAGRSRQNSTWQRRSR